MTKSLKIWLTIGIILFITGIIGYFSGIALIAIGFVLLLIGLFWEQLTKTKYFVWLLSFEQIFSQYYDDCKDKNDSACGNNKNCRIRIPNTENCSNKHQSKSKNDKFILHNIPPKDKNNDYYINPVNQNNGK